MAPPLTPEEQAAAALAEQLKNANDLVAARQALVDLTKQQLENIKNAGLGLEDEVNILQQQITAQRALAEVEKRRADTAVQNASSAQAKLDAELRAAKALLELEEKRFKAGEITEQQLQGARESFVDFEGQVGKVKEVADELYNSFGNLLKGNIVAGLKGIGSAIMKSIGPSIMGKLKDSLLEVVATIGRGGAAGGGLLAGLAGFAAALVVISVALSIFKKVFDLAVSVVDASNAFQKATGTSNEFASSLVAVGNEARKFGGTVEEVSASFQSLFTNVTDFTMMSKASREELIKTNTVLSKLGVANDDLAKSQQFMIKTMGQTATQASATSRELVAFASDIGIAPSKMMADLTAAGPQLAKFGRDGVKAFKDLAQTAKITGIEVSRLLAITEKFDTFEGAAEQAGKLNAALGGNFVNAMELLTETDPAARFGMMTDAIKDAGKSFDEMSYFEAKFFAQAMGLQDVSELALALSGNMDQVGKFTKKSSDEYEALAQRAAKVQSFQEKMNTLMAQLIPIVEPLVNGLMALSDWMMENLTAVKVGFTILIGLAASLAAVLMVVAISMAAAFAPVYAGAAAILAFVAAVSALASLLFIEDFASPLVPDGLNKAGDGFGFMGESAEFSANQINEMTVAMREAAVESTAAPVAANAYTMSQVGDSITTNNNGSPLEQIINVHIGDETVEKTVRKGLSQVTRRAAVV
jgi:hypothetical protein